MLFSLYATVGSYSALTAGFQPVAWHHLTGCDEFFRYKSSYKVAVRWVVDTEGLPVYSDANDLMRMCKTVSWKGMERKNLQRDWDTLVLCVYDIYWYMWIHLTSSDILWICKIWSIEKFSSAHWWGAYGPLDYLLRLVGLDLWGTRKCISSASVSSIFGPKLSYCCCFNRLLTPKSDAILDFA